MADTYPDPLLIFDFSDGQGRPQHRRLANPREVVVANGADEVRSSLRRVQRAVDAGFYAAGYIAYEAAPAFDRAFVANCRPAAVPLLWFGIFDEATERAEAAAETIGEYRLSAWAPTIDRQTYDRHIAAVRAAIARGDVYQVNYTMRLRARFTGDDYAFYQHLRNAQRTRYGAYLNTGRHRILSASPELFFRRRGTEIITRPMKGTVRRGEGRAEDEALAAWLAASEKNRAENVMIVDLLRNDLGRIAETGTVHVPKLFEIERYPTLFQMTSTVAARLPTETTLEDIFAALFPGGSVTGAPKVSAVRLIAELETAPRNVYCGAIGLVAPGGEAVFNLAIRTVVIDGETGEAEYGVGGGITWDSTAEDEYAEALNKAMLLAGGPKNYPP